MSEIYTGFKEVENTQENATENLDNKTESSDLEEYNNRIEVSEEYLDLEDMIRGLPGNLGQPKLDWEAIQEAFDESKEFQSLDDLLEIASPEELQIYEDAGLERGEVNGRDVLKNTEIDPNEKDDFGRTNKERMENGLPPIVDGKPLELHHIGQDMDSPLAELTPEQHRGKGNYGVLHDTSSGEGTRIDRGEFEKERSDHWKERSKEF